MSQDIRQRRYTLYRSIQEEEKAFSFALNQSLKYAEDDAEKLYLYVFAPTVTDFIEWVIKRAKSDSIERLYFMARDMWQPKNVAEYICEALEAKIEIRYLYTSRYALFYEDERKVAAYLNQEGLLDDVSFAIVDSGWLGTTAHRIEEIIGRECKGYYFGLYATPKRRGKNEYRAYYFMPQGNIRRKVKFANSLIEAVLSEPVPTTIGYEKVADTIKPVFGKSDNPNGRQMQRFDCLLDKYVKAYIRACDSGYDTTGDRIRVIDKLLLTLMGKPLDFEIKSLGNLSFSANNNDDSFEYVACEWSVQEYKSQRLSRKIFLKASGHKLHESAWVQASFKRNPLYTDKDLVGERIYRYAMYIRMSVLDFIKNGYER